MTQQEPLTRRGFNLVEAAIVLAVVGLVIGGIWSAASAAREKQNVSTALTQAVTIITNIRNLMKDVPEPASQAFDDISEFVQKSGIAPADMAGPGNTRTIRGYTTPDYLVSPWNEPVSVFNVKLGNEFSTWGIVGIGAYTISFWNLPVSACHWVVQGITGRFRDASDLFGIYVRGGSTTRYSSYPFDSSSTLCATNDGSGRMVIMSFFFRRL